MSVLAEIAEERQRQDAKFGEQNHPDGTGLADDIYSAKTCRRYVDAAARRGESTWRHILMEEFYEALAETDPALLRAELIQVAAVACAWVSAIDRREAR